MKRVIDDGLPPWAHRLGGMMQVRFELIPGPSVFITSGSCHVVITKPMSVNDHYEIEVVMYRKGSKTRKPGVSLNFVLNGSELATAFDLKMRDFDDTDPDFARQNYGDVGKPGKFIRRGYCLNLPCPGIGVDGDPNATILVFDPKNKREPDKIRNEVTRLIRCHG